jgi:hypothetical protein
MANDFSSKQWVIDTPFTYASLPNGHIAKYEVRLLQITYTDESVAANAFSVQDRRGIPVFEGVGPTGNFPIKSLPLDWVSGIQVPTLTAPAKILISLK